MNYIIHLTGFIRKSSQDFQLNPTHISLDLALFQQWNLNRFHNPVSIARGEVMRISKINSRVTYHKCLRELQSKGYFHYDPSYNHYRGNLVYMYDMSQVQEEEREKTFSHVNFCTGAGQEVNGGCTGGGQELDPSLNSLKALKLSNSLNERASTPMKELENEQEPAKGARKEKSCAQKEKRVPPGLMEVEAFFEAAGSSGKEALRFFHHHSATGWRIGHTPIQDWQAAARKWMLQGHHYRQEARVSVPEDLIATTSRNYNEPL